MSLTQGAAAYVWTGHLTTETNYAFNGLNQDPAIAALSVVDGGVNKAGFDQTANLVIDGPRSTAGTTA